MNEIAIRQADLPGMPVETVKQYVDMAGAAIDGMKAQLKVQKTLGADKATLERMQAQINEYSGLRLKAEMELGKRTAEMEKAKNQWENATAQCARPKTKESQLSDIGLTPRQASRYETLAKNEEIVNRYVDAELAAGCQPTRAGAARAITEARQTKNKIMHEEARAAVQTVEQKKETGEPISFTELRAANDARKFLGMEDGAAIYKELGRVFSGVIRFSATHKPSDLDILAAVIDNEKEFKIFVNGAFSAAKELYKIADMIQERRILYGQKSKPSQKGNQELLKFNTEADS